MPHQSGAQFLADSLHAYGVTHVFFVPAILSHTLAELDKRTPLKRILTHGEKSGRLHGRRLRPARAGALARSSAQCIGAANLAAGSRRSVPRMLSSGGFHRWSRCGSCAVATSIKRSKTFPFFKPVTKFSWASRRGEAAS